MMKCVFEVYDRDTITSSDPFPLCTDVPEMAVNPIETISSN
jgi:hypothetical protein